MFIIWFVQGYQGTGFQELGAVAFEYAGSVLGPSASSMVEEAIGGFPSLAFHLLMKEVMGSEGKMTTAYGTLCSH